MSFLRFVFDEKRVLPTGTLLFLSRRPLTNSDKEKFNPVCIYINIQLKNFTLPLLLLSPLFSDFSHVGDSSTLMSILWWGVGELVLMIELSLFLFFPHTDTYVHSNSLSSVLSYKVSRVNTGDKKDALEVTFTPTFTTQSSELLSRFSNCSNSTSCVLRRLMIL